MRVNVDGMNDDEGECRGMNGDEDECRGEEPTNQFASCCAGLDLNAGFFVLRLESSWEAVDLSTGGTTNPRV